MRSQPDCEIQTMPERHHAPDYDVVKSRLAESAGVKGKMHEDPEIVAVIKDVAAAIVSAFDTGGKILLCGNGGSAADAQHIAAEFACRFQKDRNPLPAIALSTNSSTVTAIANDFSFDEIFARQVRALGKKGDVLIGFSTSGNSENVAHAIRAARTGGLTTVALTGSGGGKLTQLSDYCIRIPSENTARIQEGQITAAHIVCEIVETALG